MGVFRAEARERLWGQSAHADGHPPASDARFLFVRKKRPPCSEERRLLRGRSKGLIRRESELFSGRTEKNRARSNRFSRKNVIFTESNRRSRRGNVTLT